MCLERKPLHGCLREQNESPAYAGLYFINEGVYEALNAYFFLQIKEVKAEREG